MNNRNCRNEQIEQDSDYAQLAGALVGFALGINADQIFAPGRGSAATIFARQVAIYVTTTAFGMSLARVGRAFNRDRSTIGYACRFIEDRRDDSDFDDWLEQIETGLASVATLHVATDEEAA